MPECVVCGSGDFELLDGLFFCTDCGTQSQNVREEVTEEAGPGDSGFVRTLKEKKIKKGKDSSGEPEGIPLSHLERFQLVLQKQADALIQLGFNPSLKKALRLIWFQYLRHYNYAFLDSTATTGDGVSVSGTSESVATAPRATPHRQARKRKGLAVSAGKSTPTKRAKKSDSGSYDTFPDDDHLFADDSDEEDRLSDEREGSPVELTGQELYMKYKAVRQKHALPGPYFFTMKHTVPLTYLSLLYTQQNILLADLVRWVRENKVPYHNMVSLLPKSVSSGARDFLAIFAAHTQTVDGIYQTARRFYHHLPLPEVPAPSAVELCHTLMDRLRLPGSLYPMVDQAVTGVHVPKFHDDFDGPGARRWDVECLAVIVMVLRLVYGLDDKLEIQQAVAAETVSQEGLDPSNAVYVWSDWVRLYCLSYQEAHRDGIPMNESELAVLEECQNYLDSCKRSLVSTRPLPKIGLGSYCFNPEFNVTISEIFKTYRERHQRKRREPEKVTSAATNSGESPAPPSCSPAPPSSSPAPPPFAPKLVPLRFLLNHSETSRAYRNCSLLPPTPKSDHLLDVHLPHSLTFLLTVCSEVVGTSLNGLYSILLFVEGSFAKNGLQPLQRMMRALGSRTIACAEEMPPL